jgi:hypothetical protein
MKKKILITISILAASIFVIVGSFLLNILSLKNNLEDLIAINIAEAETDNDNLKKINKNLEKINWKLQKIKLIAPQLAITSQEITKLTSEFLQENNNYLIILQNSDELRATGGFMGSYTNYSIKNGKIENFEVRDIYDPDGLYKGYKEAPAGMNEYLSSGNGMKLTNANWYPELTASAKNIISFFEEIEIKKYNGVIFINLDFVENILQTTGEIYLADYQVYINENNFSELARSGRQDFFPGSNEKANFLNSSLTAIKYKLVDLAKENPQKIAALLKNAISEKNIQAYSQNQEIENIFKKYQLAGQLANPEKQRYFYLVESNVGINKANRLVNRKMEIKIEDQDFQRQTTVKIIYQNNNDKNQEFSDNPYLEEAKHMSYVNYQRFLTNPENQVKSIKINGQIVEPEDYQISFIRNDANQDFKEIALLVTIPEEDKKTVEIQLTETSNFQKQSGVEEIPLKINFLGEIKDLIIKEDQFISI